MHHNLGSKDVLGRGNTLMRCREVASYEISFFCKFLTLAEICFPLAYSQEITEKSLGQVLVSRDRIFLCPLVYRILSERACKPNCIDFSSDRELIVLLLVRNRLALK